MLEVDNRDTVYIFTKILRLTEIWLLAVAQPQACIPKPSIPNHGISSMQTGSNSETRSKCFVRMRIPQSTWL